MNELREKHRNELEENGKNRQELLEIMKRKELEHQEDINRLTLLNQNKINQIESHPFKEIQKSVIDFNIYDNNKYLMFVSIE